jgi:hypothetical protein
VPCCKLKRGTRKTRAARSPDKGRVHQTFVRTHPRASQTLGRGAHLHQPKGVARGDIWAQDIPSLCTSAAGPAGVGIPGGFGRHQKLDLQVAAGYGPLSDPAATLRGKRDFFGYALRTQRPEHLGRQVEPQSPLFRLGAHPFFPRPNTKPSTSPSQHYHPQPSLRPPGHRGSGRPPLPLSHRHGKPGPSWKTTAVSGRPNVMAYRDGTHPRNPHAGTSRTRPSAPTSRPVGCRRRCSRMAGEKLAAAFHVGRRDYDIAGGACVASRATNGESTILQGLSVGGAPSRLQPTAPGDVFSQAGYSAGLTRFGRSPEGRSAAFLLAQEHAQTTSHSYGYKWARFLAYCGTSRCPLPASVETIGCYLGYLFMLGRGNQNLHSPFPSRYPSDAHACGVPVFDGRPGQFCPACRLHTGDGRSRRLPPSSALRDLALTRAVRSRRPTIDAAIAVGFLFTVRPMSIRRLQSDDLRFSTTIAFIRLRREKGNRGHCKSAYLHL